MGDSFRFLAPRCGQLLRSSAGRVGVDSSRSCSKSNDRSSSSRSYLLGSDNLFPNFGILSGEPIHNRLAISHVSRYYLEMLRFRLGRTEEQKQSDQARNLV